MVLLMATEMALIPIAGLWVKLSFTRRRALFFGAIVAMKIAGFFITIDDIMRGIDFDSTLGFYLLSMLMNFFLFTLIADIINSRAMEGISIVALFFVLSIALGFVAFISYLIFAKIFYSLKPENISAKEG